MKVGNNFKVPEELEKSNQIIDIGGYKVISNTDLGVLIQGISLTNLFELPVGIVGIIPLDEVGQRLITDFPFDIEKHHLIYAVSYCGIAWYFNNKRDALTLLNLILEVKEYALHQEFLVSSYNKNE